MSMGQLMAVVSFDCGGMTAKEIGAECMGMTVDDFESQLNARKIQFSEFSPKLRDYLNKHLSVDIKSTHGGVVVK